MINLNEIPVLPSPLSELEVEGNPVLRALLKGYIFPNGNSSDSRTMTVKDISELSCYQLDKIAMVLHGKVMLETHHRFTYLKGQSVEPLTPIEEANLQRVKDKLEAVVFLIKYKEKIKEHEMKILDLNKKIAEGKADSLEPADLTRQLSLTQEQLHKY